MTDPSAEILRGMLSQRKWEQAIGILRKLGAAAAADVLESLSWEEQQSLFRRLPLDFAAELLVHFPYYHQYVLLHSRPQVEMRAIVDRLDPAERMRFFDDLPEEAWQRLMDELSGAVAAPAAEEAAPEAELTPAAIAVPILEARQVAKSFAQPDGREIQVIAPLDLSIEAEQICALLGPSGSGKSTLLRILSGLSQPSSGDVLWHGKRLCDCVPNVAIVFQSFALFPWLTVIENVETPLLARAMSHKVRHRRALEALSSVGLKGFENAYPKELSGGMKQRVGFARALAVEPEVLFMDEPFSALDVLTAETLRNELMELWLGKQIPTKSIFMVTHNIEEAVLLADRIIVLGKNPARIRADFRVLLPQPRDRKAAEFLVYVDYIYKVMTEPELEAAAPPSGPAARPAYQRLPHARPGGMVGLLEFLAERGGREDMYHLAEELLMEVDDLFPIVEEAVMLGLATAHEGDVEITPQGRVFAAANITERKHLFREAALAHVSLLQQMVAALERKSDHSMPLEFFRDILDEHLPEEETERQIQTALTWGRYAEIFSYDSENDRLVLHPSASPAAPGDAVPLH